MSSVFWLAYLSVTSFGFEMPLAAIKRDDIFAPSSRFSLTTSRC